MTPQALLLSADSGVIAVLRRVLHELRVDLEESLTSDRARKLLELYKYDAVIIDCDHVEGAQDLVESVRKIPSNKNSLVFAIVSEKAPLSVAFDRGANLALQKPLTLESAYRGLRAAHGLLMAERRRFFRYPVEMPVTLNFGEDHKPVEAVATNLSLGGLAIHLTSVIPVQRVAMIAFTLPGTEEKVEAKALVAWVDGNGNAGFRFDHLPMSTQQRMEKWFAAHCGPQIPPPQLIYAV